MRDLIMNESVRILFTEKTLQDFETGKVVKGSLSWDKGGGLVFRAFNISILKKEPHLKNTSKNSIAVIYPDRVIYKFRHEREKGRDVELLQRFAMENRNAANFFTNRLAEQHVEEVEREETEKENKSKGKEE